MDDRVEKLPKWAQGLIANLERKVAHLEAEHDKIEEDDTLVKWRVPGRSDVHHIPDYAKVHFETKSGEIAMKLFDDGIRVSAWSGRLVIRPVGSNCIIVYSEK
jgi:hypothetical protein